MRKIILSAVLVAASAPLYAGPVNDDYIGEKARWGLHLDVEALKESTLGKKLLEEANKPDADQKLNELELVTGFNPRTDLDSVTIYGTGEPNVGVALLRGRFEPDRIRAAMQSDANYNSSTHGDYMIHLVDQNSDEPKAVAFHSENMALIAPSAKHVSYALDVLDDKEASVTIGEGQSRLINAIKNPVLIAYADIEAVKEANPQAQALKQLEAGGFAIGENEGAVQGTMVVSTDTEQKANDIVSLLNGFIALGKMQPEMAEAATELQDVARISSNGNVVTVDLDYPVDALIKRLEKERAKHQ